MTTNALTEPVNPASAPANGGPVTSTTACTTVSNAFARSSTRAGTRRGNRTRTPAALSGLVREYTIASTITAGGVAQPSWTPAASASTTAALAARSMTMPRRAPARSRKAPASGLIIRPGAVAAKPIQPATVGESNAANAWNTMATANILSANRLIQTAANNASTLGSRINCAYEIGSWSIGRPYYRYARGSRAAQAPTLHLILGPSPIDPARSGWITPSRQRPLHSCTSPASRQGSSAYRERPPRAAAPAPLPRDRRS